MNSVGSVLKRIILFYYDGFRDMTWWGKRVWIIILVKLFVILIILKLFFFKDFLQKRFDSDEQKSDYVREQLIKSR